MFLASYFLVVVCTAVLGERRDDEPDAPEAGAAEEDEDRVKGFHCLSAWDGNHQGPEALVRGQLNAPNSMDTLSTRITPVDPESG